MGGGPAITHRPIFMKSNTELTNSLRANFEACRQATEGSSTQTNSDKTSDTSSKLPPWTQQDGDTLYIPSLSFAAEGLAEEREQYDITVKLFFLPTTRRGARCQHATEAIDHVLRELRAPSIDLLIISFPGVTFDADDDEEEEEEQNETDDCGDAAIPSAGREEEDEMGRTWHTLERLQARGLVRRLGLAEFSSERLRRFLPRTRVRPAVDQINVRDCCVVPRPLIDYAKAEHIELLTHNDCTNILPEGTIRELLGPGAKGAGVLAADGAEAGLKGDVTPQWVVKYTAVVQDRGVIENKGYFAMAEINQ